MQEEGFYLDDTFPLGRKIKRVSAALTGAKATVGTAKIYTAILTFDDDSLVALERANIRRLERLPETCVDVPIADIYPGANSAGLSVDSVFIRVSEDPNLAGTAFERQLFLIVDRDWMLGVLPVCSGGTTLQVQPGDGSVMLRGNYRFESLSGKVIQSPAFG